MSRLELVPTVPHLFAAAREAAAQPLFSHRSEEFGRLFRRTQEHLIKLSAARFHPVLASGTGTWANELMVWNILPGARRALVITNGEFGDRLSKQCDLCRPDIVHLALPWGEAFAEEKLIAALDAHPGIDWVFAVATETSCGRSNDIALLDRLAGRYGFRIALDGVSAVGLAPGLFDLVAVAAVSGSSGKALAGLPGISLLFLDESVKPCAAARRPDSLDLAKILQAESSSGMVRNTMSSMHLMALEASLRTIGNGIGYVEHIGKLKIQAVEGLRRLGIEPLPGSNSPMVTAFRRPDEPIWRQMLEAWRRADIEVYYRPSYLEERKLFEIAAMGDLDSEDIDRMVRAVSHLGVLAPRENMLEQALG